MTRPLKIYGLHRTGTNLTQHLLETNFAVRVIVNSYTQTQAEDGFCVCDTSAEIEEPTVKAWKHGLPPIERPEATHILCTRSPMSWLVAYHTWSSAHKSKIPKLSIWLREISGGFANPVKRWAIMNHMWMLLENTFVVRLEDMQGADSQEGFLQRIQGVLGLERRDQNLLRTEQRYVTANRVIEGRLYNTDNPQKSSLNEDDKVFIHDQIQKHSIVAALGYTYALEQGN